MRVRAHVAGDLQTFNFLVNIFELKPISPTYGHRLLKTRLPVRSAKDKPQIG